MSRIRKIYDGVSALVTVMVACLVLPATAAAVTTNIDFEPQGEFLLHPWIRIKFGSLWDFSINKAVLLLVLSAIATCTVLIWISRRMTMKPNRVQAGFEMVYQTIVRDQIVDEQFDNEKYARKWFPFLAALFFFILFNNLLGFVPLPTETTHGFPIAGGELHIPQLAIYAATANFSVPLILTLIVFVSYNYEGIRLKGPRRYFAEFVPEGMPSGIGGAFLRGFIFVIECISHLVRIVSLSVRLFANMLAGHMLILIMGGGMAILLTNFLVGVFTLPIAVVFYVFEVVLVASLQAFIFAILSGIYIGEATSAGAH